MQSITSIDQINNNDEKDNKVILCDTETFSMEESEIRFTGSGNILFCEKGVRLQECRLCFNGNNSVVYLSTNSHKYMLNMALYNNSVCFIGDNGYFNAPLNIICSEEKNVIIGRQALVSFGVWIRTADPHLVYSTKTMKRINPSKSVFIGDHVWIGQSALILKGTKIYSGSILGAGAVIAGKKVPSNTSFAGNPARQLAKDIFWDEKCVHAWTNIETKENKEYKKEESFIYEADSDEKIAFKDIDKELRGRTAEKKVEFLKKLSDNKKKNRFASVADDSDNITFKRRVKRVLKKWMLRIMK